MSSASFVSEAGMTGDAIDAFVAHEAATPAPEAVQALALAARARHGDAITAVLFYGSALRDGAVEGRLVDLYLVARSYEALHPGRIMRWLNRRIPPNVYYVETRHGSVTVRAKYATVSLDGLERLVSAATDNPYFWARFAQPTGIVWAGDAATRLRICRALGTAVTTLAGAVRPLLGPAPPPDELWIRAFQETYRTELRAEKPQRARQLYEANAERYAALTPALLATLPVPDAAAAEDAARAWKRRRARGKAWSVARLVKASFTFDGGADYLAWKIARHSGVEVTVTPWQRRHPLLGAVLQFWRLYRQGAFR
jgi:hypothetical protein